MTIQKILSLLTFSILLFSFPLPSQAKEQSYSLNFWPIFQYNSDPVQGVKEIEGLGPFFIWKRDLQQKQWGVRPLFYWTEDETEPLQRFEFIYPLGKYQVKEGEKKGYLAPLSLYRKEDVDGRKKWDFQFFPFFIGETKEGKDYFGLFPISGYLFDRYGKEEIHFFLWPLYSESTSEGVRTKNMLWPFFSLIDGEKKKGYRFWPFYGYRKEVGISQTKFFLWPIFFQQLKGMDTDDPIEEKMVFPFYIEKKSKHFESKTFLWPFFSHTKDRLSGFEQWDLPWPVFQTLKGENLEGMKIFPLYGYRVKGGTEKRTFILYPLYQMEEDQKKEGQERTIRILLLSRIRTGENDQGMKKKRSLRIWPLFDYEREEAGHETFSFFYLFPFKEEGFERNLFPLFRIFRWEKDQRGGISTNFLWGLYKREKKEDRDFWEIAYLIHVKKEEGRKTLSLLQGLFQYQNDGEMADLRLFYLPFHLRWSFKEGGHSGKLWSGHGF